MIEPIIIRVSGSTGTIYTIAAARVGDDLTISCSCPAGVQHRVCHHRIDLLYGDRSSVVEGKELVGELIAMTEGTDVGWALWSYISASNAHGRQSPEAKEARAVLAQALDDGPAANDLRELVGETVRVSAPRKNGHGNGGRTSLGERARHWLGLNQDD